jgi:hypothetical protein
LSNRETNIGAFGGFLKWGIPQVTMAVSILKRTAIWDANFSSPILGNLHIVMFKSLNFSEEMSGKKSGFHHIIHNIGRSPRGNQW